MSGDTEAVARLRAMVEAEHGSNVDASMREHYTVRVGLGDLTTLLDAIEGNAEAVARRFHEAYERLAPSFGYKTREASAVPWGDVPEPNRSLMVAVAGEVLVALGGTSPDALSTRQLVHALIKRLDRDDEAFSLAMASLLGAALDGHILDHHLDYRPADHPRRSVDPR